MSVKKNLFTLIGFHRHSHSPFLCRLRSHLKDKCASFHKIFVRDCAFVPGLAVETCVLDIHIFIGIVPLGLTMLCYYLLKKKNVSVTVLIIGVIILSILLSLLGIA